MPLLCFHDTQFGAVDLVGERVVCVHGGYCRPGKVVN